MEDHWSLIIVLFFVLLWILSTKDNEFIYFKILYRKLNIYINSISFMIYSKDNKGIGPKYNPDPDLIKDQPTDSKTIIFLRHGESDWNNVFNKGVNISLIFRLVSALYEEVKLLFYMDSKFIDSPLNEDGLEQAHELCKFIDSTVHPEASKTTKEVLDILRGSSSATSVIVSSTLRRAIATTTVSLWSRIQKTEEKIIILSSLQEISRNIDTQSLSGPNELADLPFSRLNKYCNLNDISEYKAYYDTTENFGNKRRNFYGIKRLRSFSEWVFQRKESTIIVGGHSLWFKSFFQTYLPFNIDHDAKKKKITNSGVVVFTFHRKENDDGIPVFRIDPNSIEVVYGGFTTK